MKKLLLTLFLCLLLPCTAFAASSAAVPALNLAGLTELLAQNRGKVIMLNFFATWCPPCQVEIPELVQVSKKYAGKDVLVVGLSVDDEPGLVGPFIKKMGMEYPVYIVDRDVARAFQVSSIPHNVFYARGGQRVISEPGIADAEMMEMVFDKLLE